MVYFSFWFCRLTISSGFSQMIVLGWAGLIYQWFSGAGECKVAKFHLCQLAVSHRGWQGNQATCFLSSNRLVQACHIQDSKSGKRASRLVQVLFKASLMFATTFWPKHAHGQAWSESQYQKALQWDTHSRGLNKLGTLLKSIHRKRHSKRV